MKINLKRTSLAAVALAALLPLAACGGGNQPIRAGGANAAAAAATAAPKPSTPVPTVGVNKSGATDWCANIVATKITTSADLASHWTKADLAAAYCQVLTMEGAIGWTNLALPATATSPEQIVETVRPWLTERAIGETRKIATKSLAKGGNDNADFNLGAITAFNLDFVDYKFRSAVDPAQPIVGQRRWSDADFALDTQKDDAGNAMLDVTVTFTDDALLAKAGKPYVAQRANTLTVAMVQTGIAAHPWLVDAWDAKFHFAKPTPDTSGR